MLTKKTISQDFKLVRTCSIWRALDDVGDVPSLLILQSIWMGQTRFSDINKVACLPKAVLSQRLQSLRDAGLLDKPAREHASGASAYRLTAKGLDLFWVVLMLLRWEKTWSEPDSAFQVSLTHKRCGQQVSPQPACAHCQQSFDAEGVSWTPGPGIGLIPPTYARRRQSKTKLHDKAATLLFTESAEILGDRWSALILRSMFTGLCAFDQILDDTAMATNVLSMRLKWLQEIGLISPHRAASGAYALTRKGEDFLPVLVLLQAWGDQYYSAPEGPPVRLVHTSCANELRPVVTCDACGEAIALTETRISIQTDGDQSTAVHV